jgi:hypothetical protein
MPATIIDPVLHPDKMRSPVGAFAAGVRIETPDGLRLIEHIVVGDRVNTVDAGAQVVRAVQRRTRRATGRDAPVRFAAGSIGNAQVLMVAPTQRILISDWRAELLLGCDEVLVAAMEFVNGHDVHVVEGGMVDYFHLLFDQSQIIFAEGCTFECALPEMMARSTRAIFGQQEVTGPEVACLLAA